MKNVYLLPTDKPSRLWLTWENKLGLHPTITDTLLDKQHIYITSDEEIKEGNWVLNGYILRHPDTKNKFNGDINPIKKLVKKGDLWKFTDGTNLYGSTCKKIILTTDPDLIKDGVQAIDDEFLEWFVKNPNCEEVEVEKKRDKWSEFEEKKPFIYKYKIVIPKEEIKRDNSLKYMTGFDSYDESKQKSFENAKSFFINKIDKAIKNSQQETLEEAAEKYAKQFEYAEDSSPQIDFMVGAKWQAERMYSEEEVIVLLQKYRYDLSSGKTANIGNTTWFWFEQFKKK